MACWYSLPRKKDTWEERLGLRVPGAAENKEGAWGGGCSTVQAGAVLVWNLITQRLCSSLLGCLTWDLWVISSVPMAASLGCCPSSKQCGVLLLLVPCILRNHHHQQPCDCGNSSRVPNGLGHRHPKSISVGKGNSSCKSRGDENQDKP